MMMGYTNFTDFEQTYFYKLTLKFNQQLADRNDNADYERVTKYNFDMTFGFENSSDPKEIEQLYNRAPKDYKDFHLLHSMFITICDTMNAAKQCEFYFRRFPYKGIEITKSDHIRNISEMYLGRVYEIHEKIVQFLNKLQELKPKTPIDIGKFSKDFKKSFHWEFKERGLAVHNQRFTETALNKLGTSLLLGKFFDPVYETVAEETFAQLKHKWVKRVKSQSKSFDQILEEVSRITYFVLQVKEQETD